MFGHRVRRSNPSQLAHQRLIDQVENYERNNADPVYQQPATRIAGSKYNPEFDAQFNINLSLFYFTVAANVYTQITAAALLAAQPTLATKLPIFFLGQADYQAGFLKAQSQFPLAVWAYDPPFIYGNNGYNSASTRLGAIDATARALLNFGDLVQPFFANLAAVNYIAFSVVSCTDVGYGTLLAATNSDRFMINMLRYIQNDTSVTGLNQFAQKVIWFRQSLFGQFNSDSGGPNAFKMPENLQTGIIDIPIIKPVTKESMIATYLLYTSTALQWSLFVQTVKKAGDPGAV